jgi:hypothetical protein
MEFHMFLTVIIGFAALSLFSTVLLLSSFIVSSQYSYAYEIDDEDTQDVQALQEVRSVHNPLPALPASAQFTATA